MKKAIVSMLIVLVSCLSSNAQYYQSEVGVRMGESTGIFYKKYLSEYDAVRPMITFRKRGIQLTLLAEFHKPAFSEKISNFTWFWGIGAHIGYRKNSICTGYDNYGRPGFCDYRTRPDIGADGLIGLDYTIKRAPVVIGLEYKPYINILEDHIFDFHFADIALTVSYSF